MNQLVVITFDNEQDGPAVLGRVHDLAKDGQLGVKDSAVIIKDAEGRTHVSSGLPGATKSGAAVGGVLGLLMGLFFLPVFGLVAGAAIGGLLGRSFGDSVDRAFVEEVTAELTPGTSAVFILVAGSAAALPPAVQPFRGRIFETSLDPELEETLTRALESEG